MGLFDWLRRLFLALFGRPRPKPEPRPEPGPTYPTEWRRSVFDAPEVHVALYSTRALVETNGLVPEIVAGRYVANALEDAGLNYLVRRGYESVDLAVDEPRATLREWRSTARAWTAKDANVLLTDRESGGLAYVGGGYGFAPGGRIDEVVEWRPTGESGLQRNVHAVLHEVGHMLGASHDHDDEQEGRQHPGMGWNEAGYWHRTPTVAGHGYPNRCGEPVEEKLHERVMRHQRYHDCFHEHLHVAPPDEGDDPDGGHPTAEATGERPS
jgi:hypothetical protein